MELQRDEGVDDDDDAEASKVQATVAMDSLRDSPCRSLL
jgi:hypothetical protein